MTELSFLIDLLLNHELAKTTKDLVASRIKEVEQSLTTSKIQNIATQLQVSQTTGITPAMPQQCASTLAAMARHSDISLSLPPPVKVEPVAVIAQTPQTAEAMNHRQQVIAEAISGKIDKASGRPRKW